MELSEWVTAYTGLSAADRVRFLTRLSWELTVVARNYYVAGTEDLADPAAVRAVNELQHLIVSHAFAVASGDPDRYPDEVLVQAILEESPGRADFGRLVRGAFAAALRRVRPRLPATPNQPASAAAG